MLASFPLTIAPTWRGMLSDFGGAVPTLTSIVLTDWWAPVFALTAAACVAGAVGAANHLTLWGRRRLVVAGFAVVLAGVGLTLVGAYLPIFALTNAVAP